MSNSNEFVEQFRSDKIGMVVDEHFRCKTCKGHAAAVCWCGGIIAIALKWNQCPDPGRCAFDKELNE